MKPLYKNLSADAAYESIRDDMSRLPFNFTYGDKQFSGFSSEEFELVDKITERRGEREDVTYTYSLDCLCVSVLLTHYYSHGATEWTVRFKNVSDNDSKIIKDVYSCLLFEGSRPRLTGILGDHVNQYSPYSIDLADCSFEFSSDSGRATHINFPYFNLEYGDGGAMLAIGWAGTWSASFSSVGGKTEYKASSVNGLYTYLRAGEEIRTALFLVAPYTVRNENFAINFWRDFYIEHNLPRADAEGRALLPFSTCCFASDTGLPNSDGSISERYDTWRPTFDKMIAEDAKVDFRWVDAGWYVRPDGGSAEPYVVGKDWWFTVGTWELDPAKWPEGTFLESTDYARKQGMKTLVWFEPERVTDPENLAKNFGYNTDWAIRVEGEPTISNNIGDPDCYNWTVGRICKMLRENKVEMYREDNNCNAAPLWKQLDAREGEGRKGITECKFIDAHYRMWDDIIACTLSYGGCGFVDSCASGGGRNDLESMRRGVPILRSDSDRTSIALRLSMTTAFNKWIPFCGANTKEKKQQLDLTGISDVYTWRASYLPILNVDAQFVQDPDQDFDNLRFGLREWREVSKYLLCDFYTLTPWHREIDDTDFTVYCFFDAKEQKGVMLGFRQENCIRERANVRLPFASQNEQYVLKDTDSGDIMETHGEATLYFELPRMAKLWWIERT